MVFESILYLAVLIISAKLFGELMHRIHQPTIIGNVLAGVIVGPALFAIVQPVEAIDLFVSIGVFFLFFLIGLEEIDISGLFKVMRGRIFAGSAVAFLIPFVTAGIFGLALDMNFIHAFAIASVIAASSLGVTAKILTDLGKLRSTIGLEIFTVTAIVEFIAIIITSVLIQVNQSDNPEVSEFLWLFAKMIIFFVVAGLVSKFVVPPFFRLIRKHLQVKLIYFGLVVGMILLVAYFAELSGIHGAIGALLLGIAVSRMNREDYTEISQNMHVIGYGLFIPIFFAGIGLHFTTGFLEIPIWVIVIFIGIIVGVKFVSSWIAVRIARMYPATTVAYGVMSKGAVDLALLLSLLEVDIVDKNLFSLLVLGTLITMIVSSVELQRKLKKVIQVKVGDLEIAMLPIYFRRAVSDKKAEDAMISKYPVVFQNEKIKDILAKYDLSKMPCLVNDVDHTIGIISKRDLSKVNKNSYDKYTAQDIMNKKFNTVLPQEYLFSVIQKMNSHPYDMIPVTEPSPNGRVIGIVTNKSVMGLLSKKPIPKNES
ncbi:cation:proton antiporter domain-containing protein [Nitrosopumilus sp. S4]